MLLALAGPSPPVLYSAADEAADFGAPQPVLALRVAQVSHVAGRGFERSVIVAVL